MIFPEPRISCAATPHLLHMWKFATFTALLHETFKSHPFLLVGHPIDDFPRHTGSGLLGKFISSVRTIFQYHGIQFFQASIRRFGLHGFCFFNQSISARTITCFTFSYITAFRRGSRCCKWFIRLPVRQDFLQRLQISVSNVMV